MSHQKTTTQRIAEIRKTLKATFPKFKMSITKRHYNGVHIAILRAPVDMMQGSQEKYIDVNHYYIAEHFAATPEVKETLLKINEIANEGVTYRETGDYGTQPSFYVNISIGTWEKKFEATN